MDKNTLKGIILIGLVFIVFMWLSPKEDKPTQDAQQEQQISEAEAAATEMLPDTLASQEITWLKENIANNGETTTLPSGRTAKEIKGDNYRLTLAGDTLTGQISTAGHTYDISQILTPDTTLSPDLRRQLVALLNSTRDNVAKFGKFAQFAKGSNHTLTLQNNVISLNLSTKGGTLSRAELKKYDTEYNPDETKKERNKVVIFDGQNNRFSFTLPIASELTTDQLYFTPLEANDSSVLMALQFPNGAYWGIRYTLPQKDSYILHIAIEQKGMDKTLASNVRDLGINWSQALRRQEKGKMFEERNSALYYKFDGGNVEDLNANADDAEQRQAKVKWIAFKNQFFSSVLISDRPFNSADFTSVMLKDDYYLKYLTTTAQVTDYDWTSSNPANFDLFLGPNLYPLLSDIDNQVKTDEGLQLTRLIPLGWSLFRWINTLIIIPVFNFLGNFDWNYGIIILLLTIFIKIILFPLTYKSYKSQAKMKVLAPDIKEINEKYPGQENAMIRQQKTMALYSKAGASPMSGCLPMLLQLPILFAMFSFFPSCIELRGQSFLWAHDLSAPDAIVSWNTHIPLISDYFGNHISLFCLLMTITNIIYTRINMQTQSAGAPGMKWMMYLMPVFFMIFFNNYAAGLSYYYFLSLLITILQTYAIRRWVVKEDDVRREMAQNAKKPKKKSGFMARLEEAQRKQQEMIKQQQAAKNKANRRR